MSFDFSITFPFDKIECTGEFDTMDSVRRISAAAEQAGFSAGMVTDHPAPSSRWLDAGGHYAQDPFVMLSLVAGLTTRLKLQTNIIVLPYRNPFVTARAVSTLDAYSAGRVILGVGAGYLKAEYKALGVNFDIRNDLMDEYLQAMKLAWTGEDFAFEGSGYTALGNRLRPTPMQKPHPPIYVGGNSRRALRRAAEHGDAWYPFMQSKTVTSTARTANLSTDEEFLAAKEYLFEHSEKIGRKEPPRIVFAVTSSFGGADWSAQKALDEAGHLRDLGACAIGVSTRADTCGQWCEDALRYGEEVIAKFS